MTGQPVGVSDKRVAGMAFGIALATFVLVVVAVLIFGWEAVVLAFLLLGALAYARSVYERVTADEANQVELDKAAERRRAEEHNQLEKLKGIQRRNRMIS